MQHQWYSKENFSLILTRYKNESKYETTFIDKVKEDFDHHSFDNIDDAEEYLKDLANYHHIPSYSYSIKKGSSSRYVSGSLAGMEVGIKLKPYGNYIVEIQQSFKPGECEGEMGFKEVFFDK